MKKLMEGFFLFLFFPITKKQPTVWNFLCNMLHFLIAFSAVLQCQHHTNDWYTHSIMKSTTCRVTDTLQSALVQLQQEVRMDSNNTIIVSGRLNFFSCHIKCSLCCAFLKVAYVQLSLRSCVMMVLLWIKHTIDEEHKPILYSLSLSVLKKNWGGLFWVFIDRIAENTGITCSKWPEWNRTQAADLELKICCFAATIKLINFTLNN